MTSSQTEQASTSPQIISIDLVGPQADWWKDSGIQARAQELNKRQRSGLLTNEEFKNRSKELVSEATDLVKQQDPEAVIPPKWRLVIEFIKVSCLKSVDSFLLDNVPEYLKGTVVLAQLEELHNRRVAGLVSYEEFIVPMRKLFKNMQDLKEQYDEAE